MDPYDVRRALVVSPAADRRLARAAAWLAARPRDEEILLLGGNPEAPAEIVRALATRRGAAFGSTRSTLGREAARLARRALAERGLAAAGPLPLEALATRIVDELARAGELGRFATVARFPGLPRALARTLAELRLAGADPRSLGPRCAELARVHEAYEAELARAGVADRATVFRLAIDAARASREPARPLVLLDVPVATALERELCAALAERAPEVLAVAPEGDVRTIANLREALGVVPERVAAEPGGSLRRLQTYLFSEGAAPAGPLGDDVVLLSAPGESRECVEVARLVQREAGRGVPFDRMAILLRAPAQYRAHLEEALRRASVPAHFARGTVAPDPSGRAFVALLACAAEGLSARRFAEYLSLGQVPDAGEDGAPPEAPPAASRWVPPDEELVAHLAAEPLEGEEPPSVPVAPEPTAELPPSANGTLRAPRRWERLVVESAVIGGLDRWAGRLAALERKLRVDLEALGVTSDPAAEHVRRHLSDLAALRRFALPLLRALAALPSRARWGEWLDRLSDLASRSLREPGRVLGLLASLHPMADVGPVDLDEVRLTLADHLTNLVVLPEERAAGRVFVAPVEAARGMSFDVVFVPGVAERLFPPKVSEDPVLRDADREGLGLDTNDDRVAAERLALRIAVGAARERLFLSYPRIDLDQSRPRVPSFYALEVMRAAEGTLPGFDELARRAEAVGGARIGWPAPDRPERAIDEAEYDLALLEKLFQLPEEQTVGTARYLLSVNTHLARALRFRARRWTVRKWLPADGLVDPTGRARAALDRHALAARSYSPTALERFAACPYRFLLYAIHGLSPPKTAEAIDALDPVQRGSLVHEVLYTLSRALETEGLLPPTPVTLERARARLDEVLDAEAARFHDELAPAIERVWRDQIAVLRADLREWLRRIAEESMEGRGWTPWRFELSFGLTDRRARDPASVPQAVDLDAGLKLRGSIDLVEKSPQGTLRATDYKTGKVRARADRTVIDGGQVLQPILYALALEKLVPGAPVELGRLYYCTSTGGFEEVAIELDDDARAAAARVAETIGGAIAEGFLPAAPAEDACGACSYRIVCGPYEETRVGKKSPERLVKLRSLRALP